MTNLLEVAEAAWRQITGGGSDESTITLEEVIVTAKTTYAWEALQLAWKERQMEGQYIIPSHLLTEIEKEVVNKEMDISDLNIQRSVPHESWLQSVGGLGCDCEYVKTTLNLYKVLCDDDSLNDSQRRYLVVGKKIKFPDGAHASPLPIVYINDGTGIDEDMVEVDDAIAGIVRQRLVEIYLGKVAPEDVTNDSSSSIKQ